MPDPATWNPMLISALIMLPLLLLSSRMAYTVSRRLVEMDEKTMQAQSGRSGRKSRKKAEEDEARRTERWDNIRNYRKASAFLLIAALAVVFTYAFMIVSVAWLPQWLSIVLMVALPALMALFSWLLLRWSRVEMPVSSAEDADAAGA